MQYTVVYNSAQSDNIAYCNPSNTSPPGYNYIHVYFCVMCLHPLPLPGQPQTYSLMPRPHTQMWGLDTCSITSLEIIYITRSWYKLKLMLVLLDSLKETQLIAGHPFSPLINKLQPGFQQFAEEDNCRNQLQYIVLWILPACTQNPEVAAWC